jgi:hypothetical protein
MAVSTRARLGRIKEASVDGQKYRFKALID